MIPHFAQTFEYDALGNRRRDTKNGVVTEYRYNGANQLITQNGAEIVYDKTAT